MGAPLCPRFQIHLRGEGVHFTDEHIMAFAFDLRKALGKDATTLRIIRKLSSTIGVLSGAIATTIHGAIGADADTVTMFAGVATLTPMMQKIWGAGEASQARQKGISLISKAQSKYLMSVGSGTGKVDSTRITSEGATLFNEVNAALIVISDAVAQRIPSLQDLKTAEGVSAPALVFKPNGVIGTPVGNQTISLGGSVNFAGTGTDPDNNLPLTYLWDFGDPAIKKSTDEDPGSVQFNTAGAFTVTFTVTDSQGLSDSTPTTLIITVQ